MGLRIAVYEADGPGSSFHGGLVRSKEREFGVAFSWGRWKGSKVGRQLEKSALCWLFGGNVLVFYH